jgi:methionyl-tRNA synthetase
MSKKIVVTSALPYANGPIHLGHLVEYIQTDIYVRFLKMRGLDAVYICADDTHGAPIEINARKQGITPEQLIARTYGEHRRDFADAQIAFDEFYSTNSPENKRFADLIFTRLKEKGDIYLKDVEQTYCPQCARFLPDRFVMGTCPRCGAGGQYGDACESCNATYETTELKNAYCSLCKSPPVRKTSSHYFFRLSAYADWLRAYIEENPHFQESIKGYLLYWVNSGLKDWDISRDAPYFGFPIAGETDKYYYVWLDAPIGYMSSTAKYCADRGLDFAEYWEREGSEIVHFIGKDIIYFHFLFWPAVLKGAGFNVPTKIFVHGFLTVNGEKMSKSRGTFFTARDYLDQLPADYLRFYYASHLSAEPADLDLDLKHFQETVNGKLVDNFCNFAYRVFAFTAKNLEGRVLPAAPPQEEKVQELTAEVLVNYENRNFHHAVRGLLEISDIGNGFFQFAQPWAVLKADRDETLRITSSAIELIKRLAILYAPVLPSLSARLFATLGLAGPPALTDLEKPLTERTLGPSEPLLGRVQDVTFSPPHPASLLHLRVARVLEAGIHPKADKLLILKLDVGDHQRQIVAGLRACYAPEDLVGRKIVVVANLKPATLRGVESQGMLLAAGEGEVVSVLAPEAEPGTRLSVGSVETAAAKEIGIQDFAAFAIEAREGKVFFNGEPLLAAGIQVATDRPVTGKVK